MADTPPDWVLIEAAKRFGWNGVSEYLSAYYKNNDPPGFSAMCDMIQKYEQPPVDRKLMCAREAVKEWEDGELLPVTDVSIRAIELWEEGFGK
jgi:hypothetical protein